MHGEYGAWILKGNPLSESEIHSRRHIALHVEYLILTDNTRSCTICSAWIFRKMPPVKAEIQHKSTLMCKESALYYWPIATQLEQFVAHAWEVWNLNFQEKPSIGTRNTAEKLHCSSSRMPLIRDRSQPNLQLS